MRVLGLILMISLFNSGLHYLYETTPLFKHLAQFFEPNRCKYSYAKESLYNMFFGCPMCFSSFYGTIQYFIYGHYLGISGVVYWPWVVISSVFVTLILQLIKDRLYV